MSSADQEGLSLSVLLSQHNHPQLCRKNTRTAHISLSTRQALTPLVQRCYSEVVSLPVIDTWRVKSVHYVAGIACAAVVFPQNYQIVGM